MLVEELIRSNVIVFHRVTNSPEAPLALFVIPWHILHMVVVALSKSWLSILVSWRSRISDFEALMMSLSASSFFLLSNPRQFQEVSFINYLGGMNGLPERPWSDSFVCLTLINGLIVGCDPFRTSL